MERRWSNAWTSLSNHSPSSYAGTTGEYPAKYAELPFCVPPTPGTTTVLQNFKPCHGALVTELMPNKPTATELSGESKPLTAVGFNLSLWLMGMTLKGNSYPTPFQAVFFIIFNQ